MYFILFFWIHVAIIAITMAAIPVATTSISVSVGRSVIDNARSAGVRDLRVTGHAAEDVWKAVLAALARPLVSDGVRGRKGE